LAEQLGNQRRHVRTLPETTNSLRKSPGNDVARQRVTAL
jgi:hypothetical protein